MKIKINIEKYLFNGCMPQKSIISQFKLKTLTHWVNEEYCGCHGNQAIAIAHKRRHNFKKKIMLNIIFNF